MWSWLSVPVLAVGLAASLGGLGLTGWHLHQANDQVATLGQQLTDAKQAKADAETALAEANRKNAEDALAASRQAQATLGALQAELNAQAARAAKAEAARRATSLQLLNTLRDLPDANSDRLSPGLESYVAGLRQQQGASGPPSGSGH